MFTLARLIPLAAIVAITAGCAQTPVRSDAADQELLLLKDGVPVARYEVLTVK